VNTCQKNECIPEVVKAMRACIEETGEPKLLPANITVALLALHGPRRDEILQETHFSVGGDARGTLTRSEKSRNPCSTAKCLAMFLTKHTEYMLGDDMKDASLFDLSGSGLSGDVAKGGCGLEVYALLTVGSARSVIRKCGKVGTVLIMPLVETRAKKDEKTTKIKKLSTKIDSMTSRSAQLKGEVAELEKSLSALAKAQAEMDKIRLEEKEAYAKAKAEMEAGIKGVQLALKVLRDYYAKDKAHAADEGGGAGIIGLLEVVESDFSKGLIEMTSTEEGAQAAYDTETKENEIEKVTKEQDIKYKTEEATGLDKATAEATSDRSGVQEELDAVLEYLKGIEDRCIAKPESYEERVARREAELAGLKEALSILENETSFLQLKKRTLRGAAG